MNCSECDITMQASYETELLENNEDLNKIIYECPQCGYSHLWDRFDESTH